jgi:hypothetical protein
MGMKVRMVPAEYFLLMVGKARFAAAGVLMQVVIQGSLFWKAPVVAAPAVV